MFKFSLFIVLVFLLIVMQLLLPQFFIFIPILVVIVLLISPKWGLSLLLVFGLWIDSLYVHVLVIPYTILLVLLGLCVELLRGRFSKQLKVFGLYLVGITSVLLFLINSNLMMISWYYLGRVVLIIGINILVYLALFSLWQKLSK